MASFYGPYYPVASVVSTPAAHAACMRNGLTPAQLLSLFADASTRGPDLPPVLLRTGVGGKILTLPSFRLSFMDSGDLHALPVEVMDSNLAARMNNINMIYSPPLSRGWSPPALDLNPRLITADLNCLPTETWTSTLLQIDLKCTADLNSPPVLTVEVPTVVLLLHDFKSEGGELEPLSSAVSQFKSKHGSSCPVFALNLNSNAELTPGSGFLSAADLLELRSLVHTLTVQVAPPILESKLVSTSTLISASRSRASGWRAWFDSNPGAESTSTPPPSLDLKSDILTPVSLSLPDVAPTRTLADLNYMCGEYDAASALYKRLAGSVGVDRSPAQHASLTEMSIIASLCGASTPPSREDVTTLEAAAAAYYKSATAAVASSGAAAAVAAVASPGGTVQRAGGAATAAKRLSIRLATRTLLAAAHVLVSIPGSASAVSSRCREAAAMLRRCAASEGEATLMGALLLEHAALMCGRSSPPSHRRGAYYYALAGASYAAAGQGRFAVRAMAIAYNTYAAMAHTAWPAVADTLALTLGQHVRAAGDFHTACALLLRVLETGAKRLPPPSQRALLAEYIATFVRGGAKGPVAIALPLVEDASWTVTTYPNAAAASIAVSHACAHAAAVAPSVAHLCEAYTRAGPDDAPAPVSPAAIAALTHGLSMPSLAGTLHCRAAGVGAWPAGDVSVQLPVHGREWHLYEGACVCEGSPAAARLHARVWTRMDALAATYARIRDKHGARAMVSDSWDWSAHVKEVAVADEAAADTAGDADDGDIDRDGAPPAEDDAPSMEPGAQPRAGGAEAVSHVHDRRMYEPLSVAVTLSNPLAVPLPVTHLRLRGAWMDESGEKEVQVVDADVAAVTAPDAFTSVWPIPPSDTSLRDASGVECLPVCVALGPLERRTVTLHARICTRPSTPGVTLALRTVTWMLAGVIPCTHTVVSLGPPLNDTRPHRAMGTRARDMRSLQRVAPPAEWAELTLTVREPAAAAGMVRDGQLCEAVVRVRNVGAVPITGMWLQWTGAGHTFLTVGAPDATRALPTDGCMCEIIPLPLLTGTLAPGAVVEWPARIKFTGLGRRTLRISLRYTADGEVAADAATRSWPHAAPSLRSGQAVRTLRWTGHWQCVPVIAAAVSAAPSHTEAGEYALTLRVCTHPRVSLPVTLDALVALSDHWRVAVMDADVVTPTISLARHTFDWTSRPLAMDETALMRVRAYAGTPPYTRAWNAVRDAAAADAVSAAEDADSHMHMHPDALPLTTRAFAVPVDDMTHALLRAQFAWDGYATLYKAERARERARVRAAAAADTLPPTLRSIARERAAISRTGGGGAAPAAPAPYSLNAFSHGRNSVSLAVMWHMFTDETAAASGGVAGDGAASCIRGYAFLKRIGTHTGITSASDGLEPHAHTTPATCMLPAPRAPLPFPLLLSVHTPARVTMPASGAHALVPCIVTVYFPGDDAHDTCTCDVSFDAPHSHAHVNDAPDSGACVWMGPRIKPIHDLQAGDRVTVTATAAVSCPGVWNIGGCVRLRPRNATGAYAGVVISGAPTLVHVVEEEEGGVDGAAPAAAPLLAADAATAPAVVEASASMPDV